MKKDLWMRNVFSGTDIKATLTLARRKGRPSLGKWHEKSRGVNLKYLFSC